MIIFGQYTKIIGECIRKQKNHVAYFYDAAASIWFEIWGVVDPGQKNPFSRKILEKNSIFSGNFTSKKSIFQGKFPKNFDFFHVISQKIPIFKANF